MQKQKIEDYKKFILNLSNIKNIEVLKHLIEIVYIDNDNRPMKRHVLIQKMSQIIGTNFDEDIRNAVQDILDEGIKNSIYVYNLSTDSYNIKNEEFEKGQQYMEKFINLRSKFKIELLYFFGKRNCNVQVFEQEEINNIVNNVEQLLQLFFYENGISTVKKIRNLDENFLSEDNCFKNTVYSIFDKYNYGIYKLEEINKALNNFMLSLSDESINYVIELVRKTLFVKLFNYVNLSSDLDLLAQRILFLDTNIVISLLFENHIRNKEVKFIIKKCRDLGIKLMVTDKTIEEYKGQFNCVKEIHKRVNQTKVFSNPKFVSLLSQQNMDNDIYQFYLLNKTKVENFDSFVKLYCDNIESVLQKYSIEVHDVTSAEFEEQIFETKNYKELLEELRIYKTNDDFNPTESAIKHDLYHLFFISNLRTREDKVDSLGYKIWFLTLDKKVEKFRYLHRSTFPNPICLIDSDLYDLILPYLYMNKKELSEEYIRNQLNSNLGLYNNSKYISLNILGCIFNNDFYLEQFDILDENEKIELLYSIQSNNKVEKLCQNVISNENGDTEIANELKNNIKCIVNERIKKMKENSLESQIKKLSDELSKKDIENDELREFKKRYEELQKEKESKVRKVTKFSKFKEMIVNIFNIIKRVLKKNGKGISG